MDRDDVYMGLGIAMAGLIGLFVACIEPIAQMLERLVG